MCSLTVYQQSETNRGIRTISRHNYNYKNDEAMAIQTFRNFFTKMKNMKLWLQLSAPQPAFLCNIIENCRTSFARNI